MAQDINVNITNGVTEVNGVVPDINGVITIETGDIPESVNANFVSDAQLTVIGNTSGTNTGDETVTTIKTKLGITTLSGSNTGDQDISGFAPLASPTFTGTVVLPSDTSVGTVSSTEIGYLDGVASSVQNQLNAKVNLNTLITPASGNKVSVDAKGLVLTITDEYATATTGSVISFASPKVWNTFSSPSTANLTDDLTGAKIGVVQKIYHNKAVAPTVPAGWVLMGTGTYTTSTLNVIFAEWVSGTRVEYWITKPA
jgi:hypothetical protein